MQNNGEKMKIAMFFPKMKCDLDYYLKEKRSSKVYLNNMTW